MSNINLWLEMTVSGAFYFFAFTFFILRIYNVYDLSFLSASKDYFASISIAISIFSYLIGLIVHRLISPLISNIFIFWDYKIRKKQPLTTINGQKQINYYVRLSQYGSEKLNREIDFQFSVLIMLRALIMGILLLGFSFSWWINGFLANSVFYLAIVITIILDICVILAFRRQTVHYINYRDETFKELDRIAAQEKMNIKHKAG